VQGEIHYDFRPHKSWKGELSLVSMGLDMDSGGAHSLGGVGRKSKLKHAQEKASQEAK
jgi:hypothetical protein